MSARPRGGLMISSEKQTSPSNQLRKSKRRLPICSACYLPTSDRTVSIGISMTRSPSERTNEPVALIKTDSGLVYRVGNDAPRSGDLGCCKASSQSVGQERRPDALASYCASTARRPINKSGTCSGMPRRNFAEGSALRCSSAAEIEK